MPITDCQPWVKTYPKRIRFDLLDPKPEQIHLADIAHSLSKQCRFTGHVEHFFSVAEHSLLVAHLAPAELRLEALLHDGSETYTGDLIRPIKHFEDVADKIKLIEGRIQRAVYLKFGCGPYEPRPVKEADNIALGLEARHLKGVEYGEGWDYYLEQVDKLKIRLPWRLGQRGSQAEIAEEFEIAVMDEIYRRARIAA